MTEANHFKALQNMYAAGPINKFYEPTITVSEGTAEIEIEVSEKYYHSGEAVHGSVYFKMLDDAAYFAANSLETEVTVLTTSFTTYLTHPVSEGRIRSVGRVVNRNNSQFIAEAVLYDSKGKEIGRGNGVFVRGRLPLGRAKGYGV